MCKLIARHIKYLLHKDRMTIEDLRDKLDCSIRDLEDIILYNVNNKSVIKKIEKELDRKRILYLKLNVKKSENKSKNKFANSNISDNSLPVRFDKKYNQLHFNLP